MILSKHMLRITLVMLAAATMLLPSAVGANHDGTCHPGGGGRIRFIFFSAAERAVTGALVVQVDDYGDAHARGAIFYREGRASSLLTADGSAQASCADTDGDGKAGLTRLEVGLHDARTREVLSAVITPASGDMDDSGKHVVKVLIGRSKAEGVALVVFAQR